MKRTLTATFSFIFLALIGSIIFMLPFGVKTVKAAETSNITMPDTTNATYISGWENGTTDYYDCVFRFYYEETENNVIYFTSNKNGGGITVDGSEQKITVKAKVVTEMELQEITLPYRFGLEEINTANRSLFYVDVYFPKEIMSKVFITGFWGFDVDDNSFLLNCVYKVYQASEVDSGNGNEEPETPGTNNPGTEDPGTNDPGTEDPKKENPKEEPQEFNLAFPLAGFALVLVLGLVIFKKR